MESSSESEPYDRIVEYYDLEHAEFRDDIDLYLGLISRGPVLEVGVGTGRIARALAETGLEIWGIDPSAAMLTRARRALQGKSTVHLVQSDLRRLTLQERFQVGLLPLNTLWHLPSLRDQKQGLLVLRSHLVLGGRLIVDLTNPLNMVDRGARGETRQRFLYSDTDREVRGFSVSWDDQADQLLRLDLMYDESDRAGRLRRTSASLLLRYVYRAELELLLAITGFQVDQIYGSYDLDGYGEDSLSLIALAHAT